MRVGGGSVMVWRGLLDLRRGKSATKGKIGLEEQKKDGAGGAWMWDLVGG